MALRDDFIFGVSTSAYQIEGAVDVDGRGKTIWDDFSARGHINGGDNGTQACDHYHRYPEDIALMRTMNIQSYRFSIAWSRIFPEGKGALNQKGIDFYARLIDECLAANIRPFATLFHWDMPSALYRSHQGFVSRDVADYFADYVAAVVERLGDRVKDWITLNEPFEHACFGHLLGNHAPGHHRIGHFLKVMHHQMLGHGKAMQRIRDIAPDANAGITLSFTPILPSSEKPKDIEAAEFGNQLFNHISLGPLLKKAYPAEVHRRLKWFWPDIRDGDMDTIATPVDFIGVNHYNQERASYRWYVPFLKSWVSGGDVPEQEFKKDGLQYTAMGWRVEPQGMREVLRMLREDYDNPPVYITENGAALSDSVEQGAVRDSLRIEYIRDYFSEVVNAADAGSDLRGYFVWSLLDNFEWAEGFSKRFGLVHVDYSTLQRTIKDSGYWYAQLIQQHSGA